MNNLVKENIPFGMVPNDLLNDKRISLKAKGLFGYMCSKPNNWSFSAKKIATQCKESVDSIGSGLNELEMYGYLRRVKNQSSKGFQTTYFLFFNQTTENPILENPILENPILENPMLGKTLNNSNKEVSNKEVSNKEEREGTALAFFQKKYPTQYEALMMRFKKQINDFVKFTAMFEATVEMEKLEWDCSVLSGRFKKFAFNWISNQGRFDVVDSKKQSDGEMFYSKLKVS